MLTLWPIAIAYLLGSVPSGLLIARAFGVSDIRKLGSGNIGATNVWRVAGAKAAVWVFIADIGKGALAVYLAKLNPGQMIGGDLFLVLAAVAAVLGNVFPLFLNFKGGKGVNTSLGTMLVLLPLETGICLLVFAVVVSITRYISLGSILGVVALVLSLTLETQVLNRDISNIYLYLATVLALVVIVTHRQNIKRLINHTESRFSFSSPDKTGKAGSNA